MDIQSAIEALRITRETRDVQLDSRLSREVYYRLLAAGHRVAYIDKEIGGWVGPLE